MDRARHAAGRYDTAMRKRSSDFQQKPRSSPRPTSIARRSRRWRARCWPTTSRRSSACSPSAPRNAGGFVEDGSIPADDEPIPAPTASTETRYPEPRRRRRPIGCWRVSASRRPRRRWPSFLSAGARPPTFAGCASRCACRRRPSTTGRRWISAPRSIAATSGTTFLSTRPARACRRPRERFPSFTLFVKWRGERVPLVRWRTTIGGWRSELAANGDEVPCLQGLRRRPYGPGATSSRRRSWIPPPTSPLGSMVKEKNGQRRVRQGHEL